MPNDAHQLTVAQGTIPDPLTVAVLDADTDEPIDLTDVRRVRFRLHSQQHGTVVDQPARVSDPDAGHISYEWNRGDLDIPTRIYEAAFRLQFGDGRTLVAPTVGRLLISVRDSPFTDE